MRRVLSAILVCGLAACWLGCQSGSDAPKDDSAPASTAPADDSQAGTNDAASSEFTLVNLKVPNMI